MKIDSEMVKAELKKRADSSDLRALDAVNDLIREGVAAKTIDGPTETRLRLDAAATMIKIGSRALHREKTTIAASPSADSFVKGHDLEKLAASLRKALGDRLAADTKKLQAVVKALESNDRAALERALSK